MYVKKTASGSYSRLTGQLILKSENIMSIDLNMDLGKAMTLFSALPSGTFGQRSINIDLMLSSFIKRNMLVEAKRFAIEFNRLNEMNNFLHAA